MFLLYHAKKCVTNQKGYFEKSNLFFLLLLFRCHRHTYYKCFFFITLKSEVQYVTNLKFFSNRQILISEIDMLHCSLLTSYILCLPLPVLPPPQPQPSPSISTVPLASSRLQVCKFSNSCTKRKKNTTAPECTLILLSVVTLLYKHNKRKGREETKVPWAPLSDR